MIESPYVHLRQMHGQDAGHGVRSYGSAPRDGQTSIPTDPALWDPALPEDPTTPEGLSYTSDNLPAIQHSLDHHPNTGLKGPPTLQAKGATTTPGKRSMYQKYHSLSRSPRAPPTDEYDDDCNNGDYKDNDHDNYNNIKDDDDNNSQSACLDLYPSTPSRSSNLCTIPCSTASSSPQPHRSPIPAAGASPPSRHSRHVSACYNLPPPPPRLLFEPESDSIAHATWPRSRRSDSFTRPQLGAAAVAHRHGTPGHSRTPSTGANPDPTSYLMLPASPRPPTAAITARTTTTAATTTAAVAMRTTLAATTVSSNRHLSTSPPKTLTASSKKSRKYPSSPSPSATFSVPSSQEKESNASFSRICSILAHLLTDASSAVGADLEELQKSTWPPSASLLTSASSSIASSALVSSASSSETEDNSCTVAATPENRRHRHSVRYHAELASAKTNDFFDDHKELYNGPGSGSGQEEDEEIRRQRQQLQQRSYGIVDAKLELWRERAQRQRRPALSRRQSLAEAAAEADASKRTSLYLELQNVEEKERQLQEPNTEYHEDQDQYQNLERNLNPWEAFQEATIRNGGFVPGGLLAIVNDPSSKGVQNWQEGDCDPETDDHLPQPPTSPSTTESSQETWLRDWTQALREAAFPGHSGSRPIPIQTSSPSESQFSLPRRCASFPLRRTDLVQLEQAEAFHQVMEQVDTELDRTVETIDGLTRDLVAVASQQTMLQMKLQQSKRRFRRERQCRHSHQRHINMGIPMLNEPLLGPALSPKKRKKSGLHKRSTSQIVLPSTLGQEGLYDSSDEEDEGDEIFSEDEQELFEMDDMDDMDELEGYGMDNHGESDYFLESEESEDERDHFPRRESFGLPESTLLDHEHMDLVGLGSFAEGCLVSEDEEDQDDNSAVNTFRFSDSSLTLTNRSCRNSATSTLVSLVARMEKEQGPDSATTTISSTLGQHENQGQEGRILDRRMLKQLLEPVAEGQHDDTLGSLRLTEATVSRLLMELRYLNNEAGIEKDETEIENFSQKVLSRKKNHHPGAIQHVAEIFSHPRANEFDRTPGLLGCGFEEERKVKIVEAEVEKVVGKILVEDKTGQDFERDIALASPMTPLPTHVSLSVNRSREQDLGLDSDTSRGVETEPYLTPIPTASSSSPPFNATDRPLIRQMQMPTWPPSEPLPLSGPSLGGVIVREQGRIPPELVYSAEAVILTMMDLLRMMYWGVLFMVGALVVDEHLTSAAGQRVVEIIGRVQGVLLMPSKTKRLAGPDRPRSRNIGDGGSSVHSSESGRGSRMRYRPRRRQQYQGQRGQPAFAKEMECDQWYSGMESDRLVPKAGTFGRRQSLVGTRARKHAQSRSRQTMFV